MTIVAGFSSSRQGTAPLNLAAQISRWTGDKVVAAAIVERPWPAKDDPIEHEYLRHVTSQAGAFTRKSGRSITCRPRYPRGGPPINIYSNGFD
jgi:hypothetical protein